VYLSEYIYISKIENHIVSHNYNYKYKHVHITNKFTYIYILHDKQIYIYNNDLCAVGICGILELPRKIWRETMKGDMYVELNHIFHMSYNWND
jgi:hypothetical protein